MGKNSQSSVFQILNLEELGREHFLQTKQPVATTITWEEVVRVGVCMGRDKRAPCQEVGRGPLMELSVVDDRVVQKPKTGRYKVGNDHINLRMRCFYLCIKRSFKEQDLVVGRKAPCNGREQRAAQRHQQRHKATEPSVEARVAWKSIV